jgi:hypothetical protein
VAIPLVRQPLTEGLGNLASSLLLAPQMARRNNLQEQEREDRLERERRALAQSLQLEDLRGQRHAADRAAEHDFQRELYGLKTGTKAAAADAKLANQTIPPTLLNDIRKNRGSEFTEAMVDSGYSPETYRRLPPGDPHEMRGQQPDAEKLRAMLGLSVPAQATTGLPSIEPPDEPEQPGEPQNDNELREALLPSGPAAAPAAPAPVQRGSVQAAPAGMRGAPLPKPGAPRFREGPPKPAPITFTATEHNAIKQLDPASAAQWQQILASGDAKKIALARRRLLEP